VTDTKAFDLQLGDAVAVMVISLRSGYSLPQILPQLALQAPEPTASAFAGVAADLERGQTLDQALSNLSERIPSVYLRSLIETIDQARQEQINLPDALKAVGQAIWEHVGTDGRSDAYLRVLCEQVHAPMETFLYGTVRVEALLGQLSPGARDLVRAAASIGPAFTLDALAQAGNVDDDARIEQLEELRRYGMIREQGKRSYCFAHEKLREVIQQG